MIRLLLRKDPDLFNSTYVGRGDGGGEEDGGKANWRVGPGYSAEESTRSGIPGEVPTVSVMTSSGSRMKSSSCEISVT